MYVWFSLFQVGNSVGGYYLITNAISLNQMNIFERRATKVSLGVSCDTYMYYF